MNIPARLPYSWIPDERVKKCCMCNVEFSMLNRKHHCRSCGKIYCSNCCYEYQSLPSYMPRTHSRFCDGKKHRVCNICYDEIRYTKHSKDTIIMISLLPLSIPEICQLQYVCKRWQLAVKTVIGVFKSLQYKTSYQPWSGMERRLIQTHWKSFQGHSRLMTQAIRGLSGVMDISHLARYYKDKLKIVPCSHMFCNATCSDTFTVFDLFELLSAFPSNKILESQEMESWIGTELNKLDVQWLYLLIPWILQSGYNKSTQRIIANNIIPLVQKNLKLIYKFYFECNLLASSDHKYKSYYRSILNRFIGMLDKKVYEMLDKTEQLLLELRNPNKLKSGNRYDFSDIRLPFDPDIILHDIQLVNIVQLHTYTKPWIIPIKTNKGDMSILIKHDDVRKDRFVMDIIQILQEIEKTLCFKRYHVLPVTIDYGIIEMIPDATTLYDINKTTNLSNYIIRQNMNKTMIEIRDTFIKSCASNCVLGYMLGIGDRNLGNILVSKDGSMTHIDFSYILGTDPKWEELTEMRITPGMVNLLGGKESEEFDQLKKSCSSMYGNLKPYTFFWYTLFQYLATCQPNIYPHNDNIHDIQLHIEKRLMPEATKEEIEMNIIDIVDKNSGSHVAGWLDSIHSVKTSVESMLFKLNI